MTSLTLFASTFILVFALGLQSLNVNNGHYLLAALTSFVIGAGQMVLYKLAPNAGWTDIAAYLCGGPFGIIAAMRAHPYLARIIKRGKPLKSVQSYSARPWCAPCSMAARRRRAGL
jgi:hypothetical protein